MEINLLQHNAELEIERYLRYSLTAGLIIVFLLALGIFYSYRQKVKTNHTLLEQQQEILAKNQELERAVQQLKNAQGQLVQAEKMASLGQLTAGIAHEINNPVNFIHAGARSLKTNFAELMEVLDAYCLLDEHNIGQALPRIEALKQELQLTELRHEAEELLASICRGAERTAEIVRSLRTFSRLDEDTLKTVDLHENLDATLIMLRNQYRDRIEIVRQYGQLPVIECYPGKLNQVFMNILVNAIQAIPAQGCIVISTALIKNRVRIDIRDNGSGMSEEVKTRIFEPFFTTKDVGQGTGLGLSISHSIIEKHKGSIEVESKQGAGSCFTIHLPVKHGAI